MQRYVAGDTPVPRVVVYALLYAIEHAKDRNIDSRRKERHHNRELLEWVGRVVREQGGQEMTARKAK